VFFMNSSKCPLSRQTGLMKIRRH